MLSLRTDLPEDRIQVRTISCHRFITWKWQKWALECIVFQRTERKGLKAETRKGNNKHSSAAAGSTDKKILPLFCFRGPRGWAGFRDFRIASCGLKILSSVTLAWPHHPCDRIPLSVTAVSLDIKRENYARALPEPQYRFCEGPRRFSPYEISISTWDSLLIAPDRDWGSFLFCMWRYAFTVCNATQPLLARAALLDGNLPACTVVFNSVRTMNRIAVCGCTVWEESRREPYANKAAIAGWVRSPRPIRDSGSQLWANQREP